jgi:hypothetical protein
MDPFGMMTTAYTVNGCVIDLFNWNVAEKKSPRANDDPFSRICACGT